MELFVRNRHGFFQGNQRLCYFQRFIAEGSMKFNPHDIRISLNIGEVKSFELEQKEKEKKNANRHKHIHTIQMRNIHGNLLGNISLCVVISYLLIC